MDPIVGRDAEFAAVRELLDGTADGPAVLVLAGEAGIGKTTLWRAGVQAARDHGLAVLACRPAPTEVQLSYAGLSDLLTDVGADRLDPLPSVQRRALEAALLRGSADDPAPDPRAVATGFLSVLDGLARTGPLLVAIDDIQWLDRPSLGVVEFGVRRCQGPVAVLVAHRDDDQREPGIRPRDPARRRTVPIGPLSLAALHHLISQRIGRALPRPTLVRLVEASGGNPFFALEIARSIDLSRPGPSPLPGSLRAVVRDRLEELAPPIREAVLVCSALAAPHIDLVERALDGGDAADLLGAAEDHGVIELSAGGSVAFTHPLLATGAYTEASPTARRALHRRLSAVADDPEERARHLALAAIGPDAEVVPALDAAATTARARGAPAAAAELLELAIELGAEDASRRVRAAQDHLHAGDLSRARHLLESAITDLEAGARRAEALVLLATIRFEAENYVAAAELLERAIAEAGPDAVLRCSATLDLCFVLANLGRIPESARLMMTAVEEAGQLEEPGLLAEALGGAVMTGFLCGDGVDEDALARALTLEDTDRRTHATRWPTYHAALLHLWTHQLGEARRELATARQRCLDHGDETDLWHVSAHATDAACMAGDIGTAEAVAADTMERALLLGTDNTRAHALQTQAHVDAWVGRVEDARSAAQEAIDLFVANGMVSGRLFAARTLGMAELSVGRHDAVVRSLAPATEAMANSGLVEPRVMPFLPDAVEALVVLGRLADAEPLVAMLERSGRSDRPWAEAVGSRCRGLLWSAAGQPDEALAALEQAVAAHDRLPQLRYDRARTLLALGQLQRRRNRRRDARAALDEAADLFEEVGCRQWARNAQDELGRLGLRPGQGDRLTPTEEHVAELVATGLTVREAAAAMFVSPKTVEAHLTRVYRKLGVRSRAELGRHMAVRGPAAGDPR